MRLESVCNSVQGVTSERCIMMSDMALLLGVYVLFGTLLTFFLAIFLRRDRERVAENLNERKQNLASDADSS